MKVAHLTTVDLSLQFLIRPQLEAVVEAGGEALGISAPGPWVEELERAGIRHLPLESSTRGVAPVADMRSALDLWRILRRERPDILHTHNPKPGLYGRVVGRLAGVPIVVNTVHGLYAAPDDPWLKRALVYCLEAIAARFSDAELVQSAEDLELMFRWRLVSPGGASWLGNGVDLKRFTPEGDPGRDRASVRAGLELRADQIAVAMVGRLVAEKGYPELFEAVERLDPRYVVFAIGPDDPSKADALTADSLALARSAGVRFLGMRTDIEDLYRAMDLFVLPSHREGYPRAAMEAAASGLPIIATDIRGCREVVEDGVNGLLVRVGDVDALAMSIRRLGDDPSLRAQMGAASVERSRRLFDESKIVERVMACYRRVARLKGMSALIVALGVGSEAVTIREARLSDAVAVARLHAGNITTGFLSSLGVPFLTHLYRSLIAWPRGVVLVADAGAGPVGFVAGAASTRDFYRHFVRRSGVPAALAASGRLLRPSGLRMAWETFRYRTDSAAIEAEAELLAMAVDLDYQGLGWGYRLGRELLLHPLMIRAGNVRVVVGQDNMTAIGAYQKLGFEAVGSIEVHSGETSTVLVRSAE